jgi:hypothetical protein
MVAPVVAALIPAVIEAASKALDRIFPDPNQAAAAKLELLKMQQAGELRQLDADVQLALQQMQINMIEASSTNPWASGWRPAAGWAGVAGMAYTAILQPLLAWGSAVKGWPIPPDVGSEELWAVLFGLLGLGTLRSYDKTRGTAQ